MNTEDITQQHWEFIEALIELSENQALREFLFTEGFKHGYKHGYADAIKLRNTPIENPLRGLDEGDGISPTCHIMEHW